MKQYHLELRGKNGVSKIQKNIFSVVTVAIGILFLTGSAFKVTCNNTEAESKTDPSAQKVAAETASEHNKEEESGRIPVAAQRDPEIPVYDPLDTIYYKDYYTCLDPPGLMDIEIPKQREVQEILEDYFVEDGSKLTQMDYLVDMFYDNRTIETSEEELEQLFWEHGYLISFHNAEFQDFHMRFVQITEKDGLSLYPVRILMQTWDDNFIYLQNITGPIPRKIMNLMVINDEGVWKLIVHSTGFSKEFIVEEELSFWEFIGTYWILVPMELEINTENAYIMRSYYTEGLMDTSVDTDELYEAVYYRDGIAYRPSLQSHNRYNGKLIYRMGIMEEVVKNRSFRLISVLDGAEGLTVEGSESYIEFRIK